MTPAELPEYLSVRIFGEENLLHITWLRSVNSAEYRQGLNIIRQLIQEHDIRLWLADSRQLSHVTFEDQQWIMKELVPLLLKSRLHKIARVVSSDVFSYITFENIVNKAHQNYCVEGYMEQFTSLDSALSWLRMKD